MFTNTCTQHPIADAGPIVASHKECDARQSRKLLVQLAGSLGQVKLCTLYTHGRPIWQSRPANSNNPHPHKSNNHCYLIKLWLLLPCPITAQMYKDRELLGRTRRSRLDNQLPVSDHTDRLFKCIAAVDHQPHQLRWVTKASSPTPAVSTQPLSTEQTRGINTVVVKGALTRIRALGLGVPQ